MPFYIDMQEPQQPSFVPLKTDEEKMAQWQESQRQYYLMPGRTVKRTYGLNYQFGLKPEHKLKGNCYLLVKK